MRVTDTHVFFWGDEFSNWYDCQFKYKGLTFYNSEQAFMWEKAMYFDDIDIADLILKTHNPKENKKLGRKVKNFNTELWMVVSYPIMVAINIAKYSQGEKSNDSKYFKSRRARTALLDTGDKTLVEASPYDKIWGIGLGLDNDDCLDETKWRGMNLLGRALMEVRKTLKDEEHN